MFCIRCSSIIARFVVIFVVEKFKRLSAGEEKYFLTSFLFPSIILNGLRFQISPPPPSLKNYPLIFFSLEMAICNHTFIAQCHIANHLLFLRNNCRCFCEGTPSCCSWRLLCLASWSRLACPTRWPVFRSARATKIHLTLSLKVYCTYFFIWKVIRK